jgi:hypothetical protein
MQRLWDAIGFPLQHVHSSFHSLEEEGSLDGKGERLHEEQAVSGAQPPMDRSAPYCGALSRHIFFLALRHWRAGPYLLQVAAQHLRKGARRCWIGSLRQTQQIHYSILFAPNNPFLKLLKLCLFSAQRQQSTFGDALSTVLLLGIDHRPSTDDCCTADNAGVPRRSTTPNANTSCCRGCVLAYIHGMADDS